MLRLKTLNFVNFTREEGTIMRKLILVGLLASVFTTFALAAPQSTESNQNAQFAMAA